MVPVATGGGGGGRGGGGGGAGGAPFVRYVRVSVRVCLSVIARAFSRIGARVHDEHRLGCPGWTIRVHEERVAQASRFVVGHIC